MTTTEITSTTEISTGSAPIGSTEETVSTAYKITNSPLEESTEESISTADISTNGDPELITNESLSTVAISTGTAKQLTTDESITVPVISTSDKQDVTTTKSLSTSDISTSAVPEGSTGESISPAEISTSAASELSTSEIISTSYISTSVAVERSTSDGVSTSDTSTSYSLGVTTTELKISTSGDPEVTTSENKSTAEFTTSVASEVTTDESIATAEMITSHNPEKTTSKSISIADISTSVALEGSTSESVSTSDTSTSFPVVVTTDESISTAEISTSAAPEMTTLESISTPEISTSFPLEVTTAEISTNVAPEVTKDESVPTAEIITSGDPEITREESVSTSVIGTSSAPGGSTEVSTSTYTSASYPVEETTEESISTAIISTSGDPEVSTDKSLSTVAISISSATQVSTDKSITVPDISTSGNLEVTTSQSLSTAEISTGAVPEGSTEDSISTAEISTSSASKITTSESISTSDISTSVPPEVTTEENISAPDISTSAVPERSTEESIPTADISTSSDPEVTTDESISTAEISTSPSLEQTTESILTADISTSAKAVMTTDQSKTTAEISTIENPMTAEEIISTPLIRTSATTVNITSESISSVDTSTSATPERSTEGSISTVYISTSSLKVTIEESISTAEISTSVPPEMTADESISTAEISKSSVPERSTEGSISTPKISSSAPPEVTTSESISTPDISTSAPLEWTTDLSRSTVASYASDPVAVTTGESMSTTDIITSDATDGNIDETISTPDISTSNAPEVTTVESKLTANIVTSDAPVETTKESISTAEIITSGALDVSTAESTSAPDISTSEAREETTDESISTADISAAAASEMTTDESVSMPNISTSDVPKVTTDRISMPGISTSDALEVTSDKSMSSADSHTSSPLKLTTDENIPTHNINTSDDPEMTTVESVSTPDTSTGVPLEVTTDESLSTLDISTPSRVPISSSITEKKTTNLVEPSTSPELSTTQKETTVETLKSSTIPSTTDVQKTAGGPTSGMPIVTSYITSTAKLSTIGLTTTQSTSTVKPETPVSLSPSTLPGVSTGYSTLLTSVGTLNTTVISYTPVTSWTMMSTSTQYTSISTPFGYLSTTSALGDFTTTMITTAPIVVCDLPCENGKCYFKPGTMTPACLCNNGYIPDPTQLERMCLDIDECEQKTCEQFCSNTIGGYECSCQDGYTPNPVSPTQCIQKDYCNHSPCNHGLCINGLHGFTCSCFSGWEGQTCDEDIDECTTNNPCSRGTCINTLGSYTCQCIPGWTGLQCTMDVNECLVSPCPNGKCFNTFGSYFCNCDSGYTGVNCSEDVNECLSNPCRNGATCNDLPNSFSCSCVPGFTGRFCEININDCTRTSCSNGGVCIDLVNDFICSCPSNWKGKTCSEDVDECTTGRHWCSPNAFCTNTPGSYNCTCNSGYIGDGVTCKENRLFEYQSGIKATRHHQDFVSPMIDIPTDFPFGASFYSTLYFTDNGVIIFKRNFYDPVYNQKYSHNFYDYDLSTPPMIAIFWADADFSKIGELYYQTYDFQASPDQHTDFKTDLESEIKSYFPSLPVDFKALWAIKITWHQVPPYPGYFFKEFETNTYQAVLVTDGIFSFCLMRYADGGMNWSYNSLPNYYLPKMGYFSGEPSYSPAANFPSYNDPHTNSLDIRKIHKPDQYIGQNTNKKGYWAYRLEYNTAHSVNYKQKCLSWYYSDSKSHPYWRYHTNPCPCSESQAIFDPSYTPASRLYSYGFQQKNTALYSSYDTYQSTFSSWHGGGTRCYYNYWGGLSYGEKERYLPTPWEYENSWLRWSNPYIYYTLYYNYFMSEVQRQRSQYKEQEVDPYNNCCLYSGSSYLCSLYRERRPYDYCYGYVPPNFGFLFGDPHINTLDGVKYTFNGLGEFILTNVKDENDTVIFRLQGRTARAWNGTHETQATNFVGLAAIIQDETTIEWMIQGSNSTIVKLNGTEFNLPDNSTYVRKITLEKTSKDEIQASFDGGISITVSANEGALSFVTMLDTIYKNKTEGLLGIFNDDKTDDLMATNGTKLEFNGVNLPNDSLIFEIGMTWKTSPSDSLFIYNETIGESWYTYNNNTFVPLFYDELLLMTDSEIIKKANETCQGNDECIFDVLSTGNEALGKATLDSIISANEQSSTMNNFPPNVTGPTTIFTKLMEPITIIYTATDKNNDTVIFSLETNSADINITGDGVLVWYPTSSTPVNATIVANDSKVATDMILTLVLCNCTNDGDCLYDSSISLGNETTNFKVSGCNCSPAWTGMYCEMDFYACAEYKCYVNDTCEDAEAPDEGYTCGPCPEHLTGDGETCTDINECADNTSECQQDCNHFLGGYNCSCYAGYDIDEKNRYMCVDIDECNNGDNTCANNTDCTNLPGDFSCGCKSGYDGDPFILCTDIDECANDNSSCPNQSICVNTDGSYDCECLPGYGGKDCSDIDECLENVTACPDYSNCTNTPGSYKCECHQGYDGEDCTDIDECTTMNDCSLWADCENTEGAYNCTCRDGYSGNGMECTDIDECSENVLICGVNALCMNTNGSYECSCNTGFIHVNGTCEDIVECDDEEYCTGAGRLCINEIGSYKCICQPGYTEDSDSCVDINECSSPALNNCSENAICSNVAGSFYCHCLAYYTGDGINCTAIPLFPYGANTSDINYHRRVTDFTSPVFQPKTGFPFGNSLRNFVYYTDNGLIVFPRSKNSVFSYTHPPVNGFSETYNLASIAAYWSDADLSKGVGTTYYQEYTNNDGIVIPEVEVIISRNFKISYTAQWTLKITWENVPAYPAKENNNKTNTYQAVLTTDGFQAFVLVWFKDGGMNWDEIDRHPRPLIGYCSGNKDNFFLNDGIAVNIHRPDLYIGSNSDVRGLWIYQLNDSAMENSRMKCLNWLNNQRENPSQWNSGLLSCPCLFQQAQADSRFRATKAGESDYTKLFRSTSPNWHNAGVRCVYYRKDQFLEGFQEQTWTFHSSSNNVQDAELQAYDWCCNDVDDPQFCTMYKQKRPPINCQNYRPSRPGWMFGDPHITTLDGLSYMFNGLGDFLLLDASDSDISFVLQGRTVQTEQANATNFQAFAVQYTSSIGSVKVEWYLHNSNIINAFLDGQKVLFSYSQDMEEDINDTNSAVFLKSNNSMITATFEGSLSVQVSAQSNMLTAVSSLPSSFLNNTKGLLGTWNNDQSDDFFFNNGTILPINSSEKEIFYYGMEWEVNETSLFKEPYTQGKDSFIPVFLDDLRDLYKDQYAELEEKCGNKTECIYDALATNNEDLGLATMKVSLQLEETNSTLNAAAPSITGNLTIEAFIYSTVTVQYTATGTGVVFSADPDTNTDINLTKDGILTWTPTSKDGFTFLLLATDSQDHSSSLQLSFVLCGCNDSPQCDYNQPSKVNGSSLSITSCLCSNNYTGDFCETPPDLCADGCFPGVSCNTSTGCGACPTGYTGDGGHCTDIDECENNSTCSPYAFCENGIGDFTCTCKDGFTGNGIHCEDINECETSNICSPNATCINTEGSFICTCKDGFTGNGTHCEDIDECETNICSPDATCTNTVGSYICTCNDGFSGDGYDCEALTSCKDDDDCSPDATCSNIAGSLLCTCNDGYQGNGSYCADIDECGGKNNCPSDATCTNTVGSYICTCNPGYTGDGTHCEDIDECETNNICSLNATCTNTIGSFMCTCNDGFWGDGYNCETLTPCTDDSDCSDVATCSNRTGVSLCTCNDGYQGNGSYCADIDECGGKNKCSTDAICNNTVGSYICTCNSGYTGDGIQCDDIDECLTNNICSPNATCTNTKGSFICTCKNGFSGNGTHCEDIDECLTGNTCSPYATCTNTIGSFICTCNNGFSGNGLYCADIDECGGKNNCSAAATCTNTEGSYFCTCNSGYAGDGIQCDDVNECQTENICSPNATCTNTIGNYTCTCNDGFSGNGSYCADIDECRGKNNCSAVATCTNTVGSYFCTCNAGYTGDGIECDDINECETDDICSPNATCTNTIGNYTCTCKDGFSGDGTHCDDIDECRTTNICSPYATCTNTIGSYSCPCNDGFSGDGIQCEDINECETDDICSPNATCTNTIGNYTCTCKDGFSGDGTHCDDIDECRTTNICSPYATCTNTIGSYICACNDGFSGDGIQCEDINECETDDICSPNATCTNTIGNYTCTCKDGFSGDGTHCDDIDECRTTNICSPYATCTNTIGSYSCACNDGFSGNGVDCSCIAQCDTNYCSNGGTCTRDGVDCSPQCTCLPAFTGGRCTDAAESFSAELRPGTMQRSIHVYLSSSRNFTSKQSYDLIAGKLKTAQLDVTHLFDEKTSQFIESESGPSDMNATFIAKFTYVANVTTVGFLNDDLVPYLMHYILAPSIWALDHIKIINVTDDRQLTVEELAQNAGCNYGGYTLDNATLQCISKCVNDEYCKNNAMCLLVNGERTCSCKPYSIYITSGPQCEHLSMNLGPFFGILFGALAFLLLLLLGIWFAVRWYRKKQENDGYADEMYKSRFSWKTTLFSNFERFGELDISSVDQGITFPHLVDWKPQLETVDTSAEVKIKRPEINTNSLKRE
ncbi:uncharacterized protein LOC143808019 isoform X2 [Ranitomeya variabilis]|uniref:uncharacterized protein LOC143808019 isoform X2 n=1 Tax=Ranitomeya variabilis TaxID=490064 RepID=UPI00405745FB